MTNCWWKATHRRGSLIVWSWSEVFRCFTKLQCHIVPNHVFPDERLGSGSETVSCGSDPVKLCNLTPLWKLIQQSFSTHTDFIGPLAPLSLQPTESNKSHFLNIESWKFWTAKAFFYLPLQKHWSRWNHGNNKPIKFSLLFTCKMHVALSFCCFTATCFTPDNIYHCSL